MACRAGKWVANGLKLHQQVFINVFETTIRALGGLVSMYDLSGEAVFLEKATVLMTKLLPAFTIGGETMPKGSFFALQFQAL